MNIHRERKDIDQNDRGIDRNGGHKPDKAPGKARSDTADTPEEQMRPRDFCGFLGDWASI